MRFPAWLVAVLLAFLPRAFAQTLPSQPPVPLPDLGDSSGSDLSLQFERRIGESISRDIRLRDPTYLDDPEIVEYLDVLGGKLTLAAPGTRQDF